MALAAGTHVGPFEVLAQIGAGGMGEVYRARDPRLGRDVALKVLPRAVASDPDRLRRFETEARAAGGLNHPGILVVLEVGTDGETAYIASELLEGTTLRARLDGKPLLLRKALDYARQIAIALAAAHDKGIVHRDLKPENLFVTRDGRVKILDFGLAKEQDAPTPVDTPNATLPVDTASGAVLGTAGYMSPEQVRGQAADHRSDIFSFGAILYEMLSGRRAFDGATPVERAYAILRDDPAPLRGEGVTPGLERLVLRCLEKSRNERFQSARDLAFNLEALSDISTGAVPLVDPARPRRSRGAVIGLAAAITLIGAGTFAVGRYTAHRGVAPVVTAPAAPDLQRITYRRGPVKQARFAPDGNTIIYAASYGDAGAAPRVHIYSSIPGNLEARMLTGPDVTLYDVSSTGELAVAVLNPRAVGYGQTLARMPLAGGAPREILQDVLGADYGPDGTTLAALRRMEGRVRLEYPLGKVLYETHGAIMEVRVSPRGDLVAFFDQALERDTRGTVQVVDTAGRRRTLAGPFNDLRSLAWAPSGDEVWFTGAEKGLTDTLYAVSLAGALRKITETPGIPHIQDITRDGKVLLRIDDIRFRISALVPGATKERDLSWFEGSRATELSADGKTVLFIEGLGATLMEDEIVSYLRPSDGSAAVRLGNGYSWGLSPDGAWVVNAPRFPFDRIQLLPTGAGQPRPLPAGPIVEYRDAAFFPDGRRILLWACARDGEPRLWVQALDGTPPRPVGDESVKDWCHRVSPDGRTIAVMDKDGRLLLVPVAGGAPRVVPGVSRHLPIAWTKDGRSLYVARMDRGFPMRVYKLDLPSGKLTHWRDIAPGDEIGTEGKTAFITADGTSYVVNYAQTLSDLYVVRGLR